MAELLPTARQRFFDANGAPLANGKVYTYEAGSSTPQATYTDQSAVTPNTNPIILDANGEADIWIDSSLGYKIVLSDENDVIQWTTDNVTGVAFGTAGTGDVTGPTSAINDELVLFSGTSGKIIKRGTGSGLVKLTAGVVTVGATKSDVGLDQVDNTSDAGKPVSTAQAVAIAIVQSDVDAHEADTANPHAVTKTQVGLGNVDNTSDATKNAAAVTLTNKTLTAPIISTISNTGTITLPTATCTLIGKDTTDNLTNKTWSDAFRAAIEADITAGANQTLSVPTKLIKRSTGALTSIAGFTAPATALIFIWNNVTGSIVTVKNNSASASAGNKILTGTGSDLSVAIDASLWLEYDLTSTIWRVIGGSGSGGGGNLTVTAVTGNYTVLTTDQILTVSASGALTATLPAASASTIGQKFEFKRTDATTNVVTIACAGSDTLDGAASETIPNQYGTLKVIGLTATTWGIF